MYTPGRTPYTPTGNNRKRAERTPTNQRPVRRRLDFAPPYAKHQIRRGLTTTRLGNMTLNGVHTFKRVFELPIILSNDGDKATWNANLNEFWRIPDPTSVPGTTLYNTAKIPGKGRAYAFAVALSQLPGYDEMTNMFEQYRITRVEFSVVPTVYATTPNPTIHGGDGAPKPNEIQPGIVDVASAYVMSTRGSYPVIHVVTDGDDCAVTDISGDNAVTNMMQRNARMYQTSPYAGNGPFTWTVNSPSVSSQLLNDTSSLAFQSKISPWISVQNQGPTTPHYGMKMLVDGAPGNGLWSARVFAKVTIQCRGMK